MMRYGEEKEAKKEAFRKYLESSGVMDSLTKVLVALYEQNDKPSSAVEFLQQKLGGPSLSEYEKLQAEMADLRIKYNELLATHQETCKKAACGDCFPSYLKDLPQHKISVKIDNAVLILSFLLFGILMVKLFGI